MQNLIERDLVIYRIGYCISTVTMDHDRIHRILELNNQLLKTNAELIRAIRERAKPAVINDIRKSIKAIKGEISHIELEGVDNQPSSS